MAEERTIQQNADEFVTALVNEKSELEQLMNSGQETDYEKLNSWATRIGEIRELIDEKELRWLELDEIMN